MKDRDDHPKVDLKPTAHDQVGSGQDRGKKRPSKGSERRRPRLAYAFALLGVIGMVGYSVVYLIDSRSGVYPILTPAITPRTGQLRVYDDFSNPSVVWNTQVDPEIGSISFVNGTMQFDIVQSESWIVSENRRLESQGVGWVQVMPMTTLSSGSTYGVMCRLQENRDGYAFAVSHDNRYQILKIENGEEIVLTEGDYRYAQLEPHELAFKCQGDLLAITLDRSEWIEVHDGTFKKGAVTLYAQSGNQRSLTIAFDEFTFWVLP